MRRLHAFSLLALKGQFTPESNTHMSFLMTSISLQYNRTRSACLREIIHRRLLEKEACVYSRTRGELTKLVTLRLKLRGETDNVCAARCWEQEPLVREQMHDFLLPGDAVGVVKCSASYRR